MGKRNHVVKTAGFIYNKLPKKGKALMREGLKRAPGRVAKGKEALNKKVDRILWGKKK